MINRYNEFLLENQIYDLLLESKVVFSSKFINLINKFNSNKISSELIKINSKDHPVQYNFIDITDEKDAVSFTPDRKAQELYAGKPETWMVVESGKYLTHSDKNNKIFEALGYNKEGRPNWAPDIGIFGTILSETISSVSGKTFVLFQEYDVENPRLTVLNKSCLEVNDPEIKAVWSTSRNNMKIGRLVRALLRSANVAFTDKDIEDFTNQYKATYDFAKDALKQFDVVKGDDISNWYDEDNYQSGGGKDQDFIKKKEEEINKISENNEIKDIDSLKLHYDAEFIKDYKLTDLTGNGNHGIIVNCDIRVLELPQYTEIKIPHRRQSTFYTLSHEENGFFDNKWKTQATRWNQLRYHNEVSKNDDLVFGDGLSDLQFIEHGLTKENNITHINVGI
jgi:hypothetical protein